MMATMALRKCELRVEGFGVIRTLPGPLFLEVLNERGLDLHNDCGGQGKCGKCRVVFHTNAPEPLPGDRRHLDADELARGLRLACFQQVREDCEISIPEPEMSGELLDDL